MYYVYIIKSQIDACRVYTGFTRCVKQRLVQHNEGGSKYTSKYRPWELVYYCGFVDKFKALAFEKYLKSHSGIAFRNKRLI